MDPNIWGPLGFPVDTPEDIRNNQRRDYNLSLRNGLHTDGQKGWNGITSALTLKKIREFWGEFCLGFVWNTQQRMGTVAWGSKTERVLWHSLGPLACPFLGRLWGP